MGYYWEQFFHPDARQFCLIEMPADRISTSNRRMEAYVIAVLLGWRSKVLGGLMY